MILRGLKGLLMALFFGTIVGAISFYSDYMIFHFFYGSQVADGDSLFWNILGGFIFFGVPSTIIGMIVGAFKTNKSKSTVIGAISGIIMILLSMLYLASSGQNIFFQNGLFRSEELTIKSFFIIGLTIVAFLVSASLTRKNENNLSDELLNNSIKNKSSEKILTEKNGFQNMLAENESSEKISL